MAAADRFAYQQLLTQFDVIVNSVQRTLVAQIEAAIRSGDLGRAQSRQQQLAAVERTLEQLAAITDPLASQMVARAWSEGAARARLQLVELPVDTPETPGAFAGVSTQAVEVMQRSLLERLDSARQTVGRRIADVYAREQRRIALRAILGAAGSPDEASRQLQQRLLLDREISKSVEEGGTGFVDRSGRRWALDTYTNMATRTITREAVVQGAVTRMVSHGIVVARVSTHAGSCPICVPYEGTLVSLGGADVSEYRGEAVSDGPLPPFHPNCAHSLEPVSATIDQLRTEAEEVAA